VPKTYRAVVDGWVEEGELRELEKGIWLADKEGKGFKTGRSHIRIVKRSREKSVLEVTVREARHRQVRRMLAKVGHKVKDLMRVRMGPLTIEGLAPGEARELTPREVKALQKVAREGEERGGGGMTNEEAGNDEGRAT
jgi:23S rRNA pseudouridine2605 synthase